MAADLFASRRGAKRLWKRWLHSRGDPQQLQEAHARCAGGAQAVDGHSASATDTDGDEVQRKEKDTFDDLLSKFEFDGETGEVKLTAEEKKAKLF